MMYLITFKKPEPHHGNKDVSPSMSNVQTHEGSDDEDEDEGVDRKSASKIKELLVLQLLSAGCILVDPHSPF